LPQAYGQAATEGTTVPYTLTGAYPLPRLVSLYHYGDWPDISSTGPVELAYYEVYKLNDGTYAIGFYNDFADVDDDTVFLDTLLGEGEYDALIQDGYAVLFEKDSGSASAGGVAYGKLAYNYDSDDTSYSYQTWALNGSTVTKDALRYPSLLSYNGTSISVKYQGEALSDGSVIRVNTTEYYPLFLSLTQVVTDNSTESGFYQTITIGLNSAGTGTSGADTYTFYYNPHFAKSIISSKPVTRPIYSIYQN
jgi:hypothetical protein